MDEGQSPPGVSPLQAADAAARSRRVIRCVVALMLYQGFTIAILGTGAPWIARSFRLDQSGIARTFAWVSLSAFGLACRGWWTGSGVGAWCCGRCSERR
jgi:hypothetical protein